MKKNILNIQVLGFFLLILSILGGNVAFAKSSLSKQNKQSFDSINYNSFNLDYFSNSDYSAQFCYKKNKKGLCLIANDRSYMIRLFFSDDKTISKSNLNKNKIFINKEQNFNCEFFDLTNDITMIDKFPETNIYESASCRSYVLVDHGANYRIELNTSLDGMLKDFIIVKFDGEEGVYSFLNFMKLVSETYKDKA